MAVTIKHVIYQAIIILDLPKRLKNAHVKGYGGGSFYSYSWDFFDSFSAPFKLTPFACGTQCSISECIGNNITHILYHINKKNKIVEFYFVYKIVVEISQVFQTK